MADLPPDAVESLYAQRRDVAGADERASAAKAAQPNPPTPTTSTRLFANCKETSDRKLPPSGCLFGEVFVETEVTFTRVRQYHDHPRLWTQFPR